METGITTEIINIVDIDRPLLLELVVTGVVSDGNVCVATKGPSSIFHNVLIL
jgi:hypothetical protein